jgi:mannose-1-phosphate guanylyltransferase
VTAERYAQAIRQVLPELPAENVISEPVGRNTAAAIALAAFHVAREDRNSVFAVFPADHVILKPEALYGALPFAHDLARRHRVVDIGVPPSHPETGYGYIELGEELEERDGYQAYKVRRFVEKPDREQAQGYLDAGNYIWNSGMFVWRAGEFLDALREHLPATHDALEGPFNSGDWSALETAYGQIEDISVDYAIMEKTQDVVAVPVDFGWRDIGDWNALYEMMEQGKHGIAATGGTVTLDAQNSLFLSSRLVAAIGVQDLIVVDTEDVLLIMPRDRAQDVKKILDELKATDREGFL